MSMRHLHHGRNVQVLWKFKVQGLGYLDDVGVLTYQ